MVNVHQSVGFAFLGFLRGESRAVKAGAQASGGLTPPCALRIVRAGSVGAGLKDIFADAFVMAPPVVAEAPATSVAP